MPGSARRLTEDGWRSHKPFRQPAEARARRPTFLGRNPRETGGAVVAFSVTSIADSRRTVWSREVVRVPYP